MLLLLGKACCSSRHRLVEDPSCSMRVVSVTHQSSINRWFDKEQKNVRVCKFSASAVAKLEAGFERPRAHQQHTTHLATVGLCICCLSLLTHCYVKCDSIGLGASSRLCRGERGCMQCD